MDNYDAEVSKTPDHNSIVPKDEEPIRRSHHSNILHVVITASDGLMNCFRTDPAIHCEARFQSRLHLHQRSLLVIGCLANVIYATAGTFIEARHT